MRVIDADRMKEELLWGNVFLSAKEVNALVDLIDNQPALTPPNETPPCYQPDGDGCAYQCYDGQDEPIEKCKACPLCCSDKQRHRAPPNEPLTPCDVCRFSPPSSGDGKPCCLCPADRRPLEGEA